MDPGQPVSTVSHLSRTIRVPTPETPPAFLPPENRREGWTPTPPPPPRPTSAAGPGPGPGAHGLWGQGSSQIGRLRLPHIVLPWVLQRDWAFLAETRVSEGATSAIWGGSCSSSVSHGLYQRFYPGKECRERFGLLCPDSYLEHTRTHTCNMHAFWHLTFS